MNDSLRDLVVSLRGAKPLLKGDKLLDLDARRAILSAYIDKLGNRVGGRNMLNARHMPLDDSSGFWSIGIRILEDRKD